VVCFDKSLEWDNADHRAFDLGAVTLWPCLAAWKQGTGCVINAQVIMQSPVVREPRKSRPIQVIMTVSLWGWPDEDFSPMPSIF